MGCGRGDWIGIKKGGRESALDREGKREGGREGGRGGERSPLLLKIL